MISKLCSTAISPLNCNFIAFVESAVQFCSATKQARDPLTFPLLFLHSRVLVSAANFFRFSIPKETSRLPRNTKRSKSKKNEPVRDFPSVRESKRIFAGKPGTFISYSEKQHSLLRFLNDFSRLAVLPKRPIRFSRTDPIW